LLPRVAFAALPRYPGDAQEVDIMRQASPRAAESLERGEELARGGQLAEALGLFQQAEKEQPSSSLLRRRECEALTSLGRYDEAVKACLDARVNRPNNVNTRALARALIGRPGPPSVESLLQALLLLTLQQRSDPGGTTAPAVACTIGTGIGDLVMLQRCIEELERLGAANDPEAKRARDLLQSKCPPLRFWLGWFAIVALFSATLFDLARRARAMRRVKGPAAAVSAAALLAVAMLAPASARANDEGPKGGWLSHWPIDKDNPESSIPTEAQRNAEPLEFGYWLQDLALRAEHESTKTGDHAQAVKYYLAMAIAVPEPAVSYVKVCEEYEALGDIEKAQNACGVALSHDGVKVKDYARFVHLVLRKPGALSTKEVAALGHVIDHMKSEPEGRDAAYELECEVGTRTENVDQLLECTALLGTLAPEAPSTLTYEWELAVLEGRFADARDLIAHAKSIGVHTDNMTKTTDAKEKQSRVRTALLAATIALLLGSAAFGAYAWLGRRRLHVKAA
jgi:tetratricopeptide (TPR) repeat protein